MADFKGKNTIKSPAKLMFERSQYGLYAFLENNGTGPEQVLDFNFAERTLYGRINRQHDAIVPKQEFITSVRGSNNNTSTITAMNFVNDQFTDFQTHFFRATQMALIPQDDGILSEVVATRGYDDPYAIYRKYSSGLMTEYYDSYLTDRVAKILNLDDFLINFIYFLKEKGPNDPITLSGFQRSNHSNIFTSGLTIDLASLPFDNDEITQDLMLDNKAFAFYLNLAKQYGFSVNKRNPGVLTSNVYALFEDQEIGMPIKKYRERYPLLTNLNSMFSTQFEKTLYQDLKHLKLLLKKYYNYFVTKNAIYKDIYVCGKVTKTNVYKRMYIDDIHDDIIINMYINIRNIEERKPFTDTELNVMINQSIRINKISSTKMIDYIDKRFKEEFMNKNGTLTFHKKRMQKKLDN